ncbi:D-tyrosyl-tRNA(Tyr) deacylase [candidate division WWE3 bacterium]|uniref:D-aminoacyl-tRNA deacylase n=1 Tax=candidate division WWE3 bacterium TaxID=2053526 RepID=A0A955RWP6_UNCKA|nr:D-tyrosyl-tRNA(Tyr) deacylase [candidate division WWE3 bacterium]
MKVVLQRVTRASVTIEKRMVGSIGVGYVILVGFGPVDSELAVGEMVEKIINLRVMADEGGMMNHSIIESKGSILVVSQFTLYADTSKGRRPFFGGAADPEEAKLMYELFLSKLREYEIHIQSGEFGALMQVELVNDGPVTILLES